MAINDTFNSNSNLGQSGFDGKLANAFALQAANDPNIKLPTAEATIEARSSLGGITNTKSTAFGNAPGLAQRALAGMEISTIPPTTPSNAPNYNQQLKNG